MVSFTGGGGALGVDVMSELYVGLGIAGGGVLGAGAALAVVVVSL